MIQSEPIAGVPMEITYCRDTNHDNGMAYTWTHQSDGSTYERCSSCGHVRNFHGARRNHLRRNFYWLLRRFVGRDLANRLTAWWSV